MNDFLSINEFSLAFLANYIDFEIVSNDSEPLKRNLKFAQSIEIDMDKKVELVMMMDEYRTKLYDDNINLMGLSEPTEINYLNYSGKAIVFPGNHDS